jgi:nicotinamidase-related amidase
MELPTEFGRRWEAVMAVPRLTAANTTLLIVDVQQKLLPAIPDHDRLVTNITFLLDTAALVNLPVRATEQYPQGLGPTVAVLAAKLSGERPAKKTFSCCGAPGLVDSLDTHRPWVMLAGMETHVCVSQTAFDLLDRGYHVALPVDAVSARFRLDHDTALARLREAGALLTTVEAVGFEWLGSADHSRFKNFSMLVQERAKQIAKL